MLLVLVFEVHRVEASMFLHFPSQILQPLQLAIYDQIFRFRIRDLEPLLAPIVDFNPHCTIRIESQFGLQDLFVEVIWSRWHDSSFISEPRRRQVEGEADRDRAGIIIDYEILHIISNVQFEVFGVVSPPNQVLTVSVAVCALLAVVEALMYCRDNTNRQKSR